MATRHIKEATQRRVVPIIMGLLLLALLGITVYRLFYQARVIIDVIIAEHIEQLHAVFKKINDTCVITDVAHEVNHIDFLNVKSFVGSEIGSLNLAYPKEWRGPYMQDNPTIQGHVYEIVKTKHGYYIVPGTGVKLTNGKIMGKDILITRDTDMRELIKKGILRYEGKALVAPLPIKNSIALKPEIFDTVDA